MAKVIGSKEEFDKILADAQECSSGPVLVVVDFFATWCPPCKQIAPVFEELCSTYTDIRFFKVDVDKTETIPVQYDVHSLPTFVFFRGTKEVARIRGADQEVLRKKLAEHHSVDGADSTTQFSGQSSKHPDLTSLLDVNQCECLNEDDTHSLSNLLNAEVEDGYLLSDTDAQLVIFITFSQFVKLHSLQICGPEDSGPKNIRLFLNQTATPDFGTCESAEAVQSFELKPQDLTEGNLILLNYVKFQKVTTLTLFISDNQEGTDVTRIDKLRFFGNPVNTTNMQHFKRVAGKAGEGHS